MRFSSTFGKFFFVFVFMKHMWDFFRTTITKYRTFEGLARHHGTVYRYVCGVTTVRNDSECILKNIIVFAVVCMLSAATRTRCHGLWNMYTTRRIYSRLAILHENLRGIYCVDVAALIAIALFHIVFLYQDFIAILLCFSELKTKIFFYKVEF